MILKSQKEFDTFLDDYKLFDPNIKLYSFKIKKKRGNKENFDDIKLLLNKKFKNSRQKSDFRKYNNIFESHFISNNIKKYIRKNIKFILQTKFIINDITINFSSYFSKKEDMVYFIKNKLEILIKVYIFMNQFFNKRKNLNFIYYSLPLKKQINFNQLKPIDTNNVNSGLTSLYPNNHYIMIWRDEELLKVYIHEIIHYLELDINMIKMNKIRNIICIDDESNILPNEAFTDFYAIIIHSLFLSFYKNINYKDILNKEKTYIMNQAGVILSYYGFKSWMDFISPKCKILIKQNTSIFSYYILKSCLFFNFNKSIKLMNNKKLLENYFIDILLNDKNYILNINNIINNFYVKDDTVSLKMSKYSFF